MSLNAIRNYMLVSDLIASSGQPEDHQFKSIAAAGYKVVINLALSNSDYAIPEEGNIVTSLKMTYVHLPVPFDAPDISYLKEFIKIMSAFENKKIWIHCALNYRVSAFLYQYLQVVQGVSEQQARKAMLPAWQPDKVWQQFMAIPREHIL